MPWTPRKRHRVPWKALSVPNRPGSAGDPRGAVLLLFNDAARCPNFKHRDCTPRLYSKAAPLFLPCRPPSPCQGKWDKCAFVRTREMLKFCGSDFNERSTFFFFFRDYELNGSVLFPPLGKLWWLVTSAMSVFNYLMDMLLQNYFLKH